MLHMRCWIFWRVHQALKQPCGMGFASVVCPKDTVAQCRPRGSKSSNFTSAVYPHALLPAELECSWESILTILPVRQISERYFLQQKYASQVGEDCLLRVQPGSEAWKRTAGKSNVVLCCAQKSGEGLAAAAALDGCMPRRSDVRAEGG